MLAQSNSSKFAHVRSPERPRGQICPEPTQRYEALQVYTTKADAGARHARLMRRATWERVGQAALATGTLNLAVGQPALSLLPTALLRAAAKRTLGSAEEAGVDPRCYLQYGGGAGNVRYLQQVAEYLTQRLGYSVAPENLFASTGNSASIALASSVLSSPGDVVAMEDPSYFLAHTIFRDNGLILRSAPHRASGGTIDVGAVEALLQDAPGPPPKLLYLVPTANNPTGRTMPDIDRRRLVELCARHGVTILSDDVYEHLVWGDEEARPRPMRWHALEQGAGATVVSLGSWSKLLGPGLRLGWVEAEPGVIDALCNSGAITSGGGGCPLVDALVADLLASGDVEEHRRFVCAALRRRAAALVEAINGALGDGHEPAVVGTDGGYFLSVALPAGVASAAFDAACEHQRVCALPGTRCVLDSPWGLTHVRVSFAFLEEDELVEAGRRLGRAIGEARELTTAVASSGS